MSSHPLSKFFAPRSEASDSSEQTAVPLPIAEDVMEFIKDSMPAPSTIFGTSFYSNPLFAFTALKDVWDLLRCPSVESLYVQGVRLSREDKQKQANASYRLAILAT